VARRLGGREEDRLVVVGFGQGVAGDEGDPHGSC
jgi:hypothetical protein